MDRYSYDSFNLCKQIPEFCIDNSNRAALCFRETLMVVLKGECTNELKPVGGYCIQVEPVGPEGHEFLVHVYCTMNIDGCFTGTKLTSTITKNLQCLEEKHTEFLYKEDGLYEKSLFMGLQENTYHIETRRICPYNELSLTKTKDLELCQYDGLIGEAINILLMRYLAITNYQGTLRFRNITIDGEVATSDYACIALQNMELHDGHQNVYTVERNIQREGSPIQRIKTYLTPEGRILMHDWLDVPHMVQRNPLIQPGEINQDTDAQIPLRQYWMQDIEVLSKYLDMKSSYTVQYMDYLTDHPEIKQLIADYVQTLLIVKPVNVIDFTIQHFKAFAREPKVWDTDSFTKQSDNDINLQLSKVQSDIATCGACGICVNCETASQI